MIEFKPPPAYKPALEVKADPIADLPIMLGVRIEDNPTGKGTQYQVVDVLSGRALTGLLDFTVEHSDDSHPTLTLSSYLHSKGAKNAKP